MKKILSIVLIFAFVFISCQAKQNANSNPQPDDNIGSGPGKVDLGGNFNTINSAIDGIVNGFSSERTEWESTQTEKIPANLKGGYIIVKDKDGTFWTILGITDNENVQVGIANFNNGQDALTAAADSKNFDPRKLLFKDDGNGALKIAWSGRAGTGLPTPGTAITPFQGYDTEYSHILQGTPKTFKVLSQYAVVGFANQDIKNEEKGSLQLPSGQSIVSYTYEKAGQGTAAGGLRKAWFWYAGAGSIFSTSGGVEIIKKGSIRFGYGTDDTDYPSIKGSIRGSTLRKLGQPATDDNSAPDGKMIFFRKRSDSSTDITFYTTMVAYNIRMRTPENAALSALENVQIKDVKEGIMEFDARSFTDASTDGFTHVTDAPTSAINSGVADAELGGTKDTIKIPFIFFRPL